MVGAIFIWETWLFVRVNCGNGIGLSVCVSCSRRMGPLITENQAIYICQLEERNWATPQSAVAIESSYSCVSFCHICICDICFIRLHFNDRVSKNQVSVAVAPVLRVKAISYDSEQIMYLFWKWQTDCLGVLQLMVLQHGGSVRHFLKIG